MKEKPTDRFGGQEPVVEEYSRLARVYHARSSFYVEATTREWAEHLPFAAEEFDDVVSCNMFHSVQRPMATFREMKRVLRPGGQLVLTDWCNDYWACRACDLHLRLFSAAHFKTYRERECVQLLQEAGLTVRDMERYKISWLWGMMSARARKDAA